MSAPVSTSTRETPMYEGYYGFVQSPFTLAPDPRFLYLSDSHDEAIRALLQSIRRKEGFIVLTGDIGTGKTTLCRAVLEQLDQTTFTSLILNPYVSIEELLREVLLDFGVASRDAVRSGRLGAATRHELISTLHDFLLSLVPIRGSGVLIIDEAQHLSPEVLEQIRVISNLETNDAKLLQIVLVGQLNLLDVLAAAEMRQLDQRISLRARLEPLNREEVEAYVSHRLSIARGSSTVTFDAPALDRVHAVTGGVPRVVNLVCDRALALGAERGIGNITADIVADAATALGLQVPAGQWRWSGSAARWWLAGAAVLVATLAVVALFAPLSRWVDVTPPSAPAPPAAVRAPAPIQPRPIPDDVPPLPRPRRVVPPPPDLEVPPPVQPVDPPPG